MERKGGNFIKYAPPTLVHPKLRIYLYLLPLFIFVHCLGQLSPENQLTHENLHHKDYCLEGCTPS